MFNWKHSPFFQLPGIVWSEKLLALKTVISYTYALVLLVTIKTQIDKSVMGCCKVAGKLCLFHHKC